MKNPIKLIYQFNEQAGLLDKGYDDFLESSFQIEEALENFEHLPELASLLSVDAEVKLPRELSRRITSIAQQGIPSTDRYNAWSDISDVQRLDKACDAIIFALGSIFKLGLNPAQATQALNVVMYHNFLKLSMPKDAFGKLTKPADFKGPEADLQVLLDER